MYIRVQQDNIRYRISREEANQLLDGSKLQESIKLSPDFSLNYQICCTDDTSSFDYLDDNTLSLLVNNNQLAEEIADRPSKAGIVIPNKNTDLALVVNLEIDLKRKRD